MGQVLMSVNPFEKILGLYGKNVIDEFRNPESKNFSAHVYSIPARAYGNMCRTGGNQSILISGESGAGKTEATKQCLSFLTVVADNQQSAVKSASGTDSTTPTKNLYASEGIKCDTIEFKDNIDTIREIEMVFKSLDEEGRIPRGTSKTWFDKLKRGAKMPNITFPNRKT
eukprot:gene30429-37642_t